MTEKNIGELPSVTLFTASILPETFKTKYFVQLKTMC